MARRPAWPFRGGDLRPAGRPGSRAGSLVTEPSSKTSRMAWLISGVLVYVLALHYANISYDRALTDLQNVRQFIQSALLITLEIALIVGGYIILIFTLNPWLACARSSARSFSPIDGEGSVAKAWVKEVLPNVSNKEAQWLQL